MISVHLNLMGEFAGKEPTREQEEATIGAWKAIPDMLDGIREGLLVKAKDECKALFEAMLKSNRTFYDLCQKYADHCGTKVEGDEITEEDWQEIKEATEGQVARLEVACTMLKSVQESFQLMTLTMAEDDSSK